MRDVIVVFYLTYIINVHEMDTFMKNSIIHEIAVRRLHIEYTIAVFAGMWPPKLHKFS